MCSRAPVSHGVIENAAINQADQNDVASRGQILLQVVQSLHRVLVEDHRWVHEALRVRMLVADVVADEGVEDQGGVVLPLPPGHAAHVAVRRVGLGSVPGKVLVISVVAEVPIPKPEVDGVGRPANQIRHRRVAEPRRKAAYARRGKQKSSQTNNV